MPRHANSKRVWTPERYADAVELTKLGWPPVKIARAIGLDPAQVHSKFSSDHHLRSIRGAAASRGAAATKDAGSSPRSAIIPPLSVKRAAPQTGINFGTRQINPPPAPHRTPRVDDLPLDRQLLVPLPALDRGMCHWPACADDRAIGKQLFCGLPAPDGASYCEHHARMAAPHEGRGNG